MFNPFVKVVRTGGGVLVSPSKLGELLFTFSFGCIVPRITLKRGYNLRQSLVVLGTVHVNFKD